MEIVPIILLLIVVVGEGIIIVKMHNDIKDILLTHRKICQKEKEKADLYYKLYISDTEEWRGKYLKVVEELAELKRKHSE